MMSREELAQFVSALSPQEQGNLFDLMIGDGMQDLEMSPADQYGMVPNNADRYTMPGKGPQSPYANAQPVAGGNAIPRFNPSIQEQMRLFRAQRVGRPQEQARGPLDDSDPNQYGQNFVVGDA
jgi:hypothetical protein